VVADEIFNLLKSSNRALCVAETEERVTPMWLLPISVTRYRKPRTRPTSAAPWSIEFARS